MRILVAEDDPVYAKILTHVIHKHTAHEVECVPDGEAALARVLSDAPPDVLILDWVMPGLSGTEVCRRVREANLHVQPHVLIVTAKNRRQEVIEGLSVGADDLLCKPVAPDLLIARLRVAARRPTPSVPTKRVVVQALVDAASEGNGELVVRDGDVTARVFFHEGHIAWAHMSEERGAFFDLLASDSQIDPSTIQAVLDECRTTGANLSDTLVRWGLVDRARLRDGVQLWVRRKLQAICQFSRPQTLFLPQRRKYAGDLLFTLSEVMDVAELRGLNASIPPPPLVKLTPQRAWTDAFVSTEGTVPAAADLLDRCTACVGVLGAALIDRLTGMCSGARGTSLDPDIAWAHIQSLSIVSRDELVVDTVLTTNRHYHLVHALPGSESTMVYVVVDSSRTRMSAARRRLKEVVEGYSGPALVALG
jgi:DNA-binding response OmpR family regulator